MKLTITPTSMNQPLAPHAFQHYARDFHTAYRSHQPPAKFSPARLFLIFAALKEHECHEDESAE